MPADLPSGTVTLLFTDIEGSTRMLQELGRETYVRSLTEHRRLLRDAFLSHGGVEVEMQGDSFHFAFPYARDAVAAAVAGQRALQDYAWESEPIKVRIGLHTGEPMQADGLYAGLDVHQAARVMSAGHGGQIVISQRTADLVTGELDLELVDLGHHRLKDLTAPQRLYQAGEGDFPPLKSLAPQTNLPVAASPLIGREAELEQLVGLLRNGTRVVTVTGAGGTGKTRLALQAAADVLGDYANGVVWVPLAGLRDSSLVIPTISQALGMEGEPATLEALLVLDNFEHVLEAAAALGEQLSSAPSLTALVTSRAPLHVDGEHEFMLDPLVSSAAVTLFIERARASGCALEANGTVAEICRRLDNLPLALELAAARTKLLTPDGLLQRLSQRLPLLTGGRRDAPERQQTLRATIEWSHELLAPEARELLARLSVFAGSFRLEAAEDVCRAQLDSIAALVDLSLLKAVGENRLLMLETIREFALDALEQTGEAEVLRRRHAAWYLNFAVDAAQCVYGPAEAQALDRLEAEYDNLRAALETLLHLGEPQQALQLVAALGRLWAIRDFLAEGLAWAARALAADTGPATAERAAVLEGAAYLARKAQDVELSVRFAEERLAYARAVDDKRSIAAALCLISTGAQYVGDFTRARALLGEATATARECGDRIVLTFALNELGFVAYGERDFAEAAEHYGGALALARELGDEQTIVAATGSLAMVHIELAQHSVASALVQESLERAAAFGERTGLVAAVEQTAMLAVFAGDARVGAMLMGAAASARQESGEDVDFTFRGLRDRVLNTCRAALDDQTFQQAWEQGGALLLDVAATEAARTLSTLGAHWPDARPQPS